MDHILPYLFFLACPISMGLMMWMMMRKDHNNGSAPKGDPRVAERESQVGELRMALHQRQSAETSASVTPTASATGSD